MFLFKKKVISKSELTKNNTNSRKNSIIGSIIGGAIGDALGYQIEFKKNIQAKEVTKYKDDKGIISDDTQMTLFTANGLLWRETRGAMRGIAMLPTDAIYEAYLDWYDTQTNSNKHENKVSWIKNIKELNIERAPGNTCLSALSSGIKGTIEKPINDSKGCGGIMRIAPIGLYMSDAENAGKFSAEASAITHGHALGNIPSYVFGTMIYYLSNYEISIPDALERAMNQFKNNFNVYSKKYNQLFINLVEKAKKLSMNNDNDIDNIIQLGEGWVAEEAFAIALYSCLKYQNSFEDAIICSVNHDGDSDSTGAIAGNIIGASLGYDSIPKYYIDNLELKDIIFEIAEDLSTPIPVGEYSENNDEYWLSKYSKCEINEEKKSQQKLKKYMNEFLDSPVAELTELDKEFEKYCEIYKNKFGKRAYIAVPDGTKEKTIEAIKTCIEKDEDLLDSILYPNFEKDTKDGSLY